MNRRTAATLALLAVAVIFGTAAAPSDTCTCPDPAGKGSAVTLIDRELSSSEHTPSSPAFLFAKTMTVCMGFDQTNKGYAPEMRLVAEGSTDGRNWFPLTVAGTDHRAETASGCLQVAPTRYVRVGWPPSAVVPSPGPRVTASAQASY